ncbi:hypothetical protein T02_632 [Trichinella nativa]|uniref:Uncharacterized protein n=1 Tax=Trichinella nativa TaxID=6335 RepID=A0A0V1L5P1_9BILA|nr:hypothetical protein T02_632 [Trichinella nativa]
MPTKQDGLYYTISGSVEKDCTKISVTICKASAFCSIRQQSTFYCAVFALISFVQFLELGHLRAKSSFSIPFHVP